jgi:hypothetical protein
LRKRACVISASSGARGYLTPRAELGKARRLPQVIPCIFAHLSSKSVDIWAIDDKHEGTQASGRRT